MLVNRVLILVGGLVGLSMFNGCTHRIRTPPKPTFDPQGAAKQATAEYDTNHDGKLDKDELAKCPALLDGLKRIDKDGDGQLSAEEIATRLEHWHSFKGVLTPAHTEVTLDGQALADATVTLEPEKFLGETYLSCTGKTDQLGHVSFSGSVAGFPGIYFGFYRVRVSKVVDGKETVPAKYNSDSVLGMEVADDVAPPRGFTELHLKR